MSEYIEDIEYQTRIVNLAAIPMFDELVDLAKDICLRDETLFDSTLESISASRTITSETELVESLGVWGLRSVLELEANSDGFFVDKGAVSVYSLISNPTLLPSGRDRRVTDKIESFGKALIDEAFLCLGEDANEEVAKFLEAKDLDDKIDVIGWLLRRIDAIKDVVPDNNDSSENPEYFYHPVRLSPKLMGVYPEIQLTPTCLSVSILAASFFEKIGVPYVHMGVALTAQQEGELCLLSSLAGIQQYAQKFEIVLPDSVQERFDAIKTSINGKLLNNYGHHAAIAVRIEDDIWVHIDPNFSTNTDYTIHDSEAMQRTYEQLAAMDDIVPGIERMFLVNEGHIAGEFTKNVGDILREEIADQELAAVLDEAGGCKEPLERLKCYVIERIAEEEVFDTIVDEYIEETGKNKFRYIDEITESILYTYVFPDAMETGIEACLVRCQTDMAYRQRRLEDLRFAPMYFSLRLQSDFINRLGELDTQLFYPPAKLEVGLPAYRIGACVLSDFATYCYSELPLSFWAAYWPSHIAFSDHVPAYGATLQTDVALRMATHVGSGFLRFYNNYGIVSSFLEQGEQQDGQTGSTGVG